MIYVDNFIVLKNVKISIWKRAPSANTFGSSVQVFAKEKASSKFVFAFILLVNKSFPCVLPF